MRNLWQKIRSRAEARFKPELVLDWQGMQKLQSLFPMMIAIWAVAIGLFIATSYQLYMLSAMKAGVETGQTQISNTPYIDYYSVSQQDLQDYITLIQSDYRALDIEIAEGGIIHVRSKETTAYRAFRQFLDHLQYGGALWRVDVKKLCLGRDCSPNQIEATLRVVDVRVSR